MRVIFFSHMHIWHELDMQILLELLKKPNSNKINKKIKNHSLHYSSISWAADENISDITIQLLPTRMDVTVGSWIIVYI